MGRTGFSSFTTTEDKTNRVLRDISRRGTAGLRSAGISPTPLCVPFSTRCASG
jgi:hypothetical protein